MFLWFIFFSAEAPASVEDDVHLKIGSPEKVFNYL